MANKTNAESTNSSRGKGTALLVGVVVGATAMYLRDKDNQKKVTKKLDDIKAWSEKNMKDWRGEAEDAGDSIVKLKENIQDDVDDKVNLSSDDDERSPPKSLN